MDETELPASREKRMYVALVEVDVPADATDEHVREVLAFKLALRGVKHPDHESIEDVKGCALELETLVARSPLRGGGL